MKNFGPHCYNGMVFGGEGTSHKHVRDESSPAGSKCSPTQDLELVVLMSNSATVAAYLRSEGYSFLNHVQLAEEIVAWSELHMVAITVRYILLYLYTLAVSPSLGGSRQHKRTTKTVGVLLCSSSNDKGPSRVWMALLEQHSPLSPVFHILGKKSVLADRLNHPDQVFPTRWSVLPWVFSAIRSVWSFSRRPVCYKSKLEASIVGCLSSVPDPIA